MDNIFTLHKYEDDNEIAESMNIDDLYERKERNATSHN